MANESLVTTGTLPGVLGGTLNEIVRTEAIGAMALFYESTPGVADFVTIADISGQPTLTHRFPILDQVTAAAVAEDDDYTTNSALDTQGSPSATINEHIVKSTISDLAVNATVTDMSAQGSTIGTAFARAMQKLQDADITALFASFNSSTGSATGQLTSTLMSDAAGTLDENNIPPTDRSMILHPKQFKGVAPSLTNASTFGRQGQQVLDEMAVARIFGATVFTTTAVTTATITTDTVYAGAFMHVDAVGVVEKGQTFEAERNASARHTEVMLVKRWGEVEYRGGATTSGRGGAGVYLYSDFT